MGGNPKYNMETEQEDMRPSRKMSKTEESKVPKCQMIQLGVRSYCLGQITYSDFNYYGYLEQTYFESLNRIMFL